MLALLRYRRIPYRFIQLGLGQPVGLPRAKVDLLPTFYLQNEAGELQAVVDSTPACIARKSSPRLVAWVGNMEDLSGLEPDASDWLDQEAVGTALEALLCEVGRVYVPVMLANRAAIHAGEEGFDMRQEKDPVVRCRSPLPTIRLSSLVWRRGGGADRSEPWARPRQETRRKRPQPPKVRKAIPRRERERQ